MGFWRRTSGSDWADKTPQEKANSFDQQLAQSKSRADEKKAKGQGIYSADAAVKNAGKPKRAERRKKK